MKVEQTDGGQAVSTYEGEGVNQAGDPDHVHEMIAKVEAPVETSDSDQTRPQWLPDKFASPEEMARAYSELETRFHDSNNPTLENIEQQAQVEQQASEVMEASPSQVHQLLDDRGLDFSAFQQEYNETGKLSDEALGALDEAGIKPEMVATWIQGREAVAQQSIDAMYESVQGKDNYDRMVEWAGDNLQPWEQEAFNAQIDNLDVNSALAVNGMYARFKNSVENQTPTLMTGDIPVNTAPSYDSLNQLTTAMSDPRYKEDPAYRAQVTQRLSNSTIL